MNWQTIALLGLVSWGFCLPSAKLSADEFSVQVLDEGPPADVLSEGIAETLNAKGLKVVQDGGRVVCELWFSKSWAAKADFKPTADVLYPFEAGQLIGALRFARKSNDFRNQTIARGVYTLRYGQQPVDGNHEGTSPTRDFLLLVKAADDESPAKMDVKKLMGAAADAAESNHPGMLCLRRVQSEPKPAASIRHEEDKNLWVLHFVGTAVAGEKSQPLAVELVVVGHADE